MYKKERFEPGLKYIAGKLKLTIELIDNELELRLYPEYPNEQYSISLYILLKSERHIVITDLVGNSKESGFSRKGLGSLIVNTAIQVLTVIFGADSNALVTGKVYGNEKGTWDSDCAHRNKFWSKFNFVLKNPGHANTSMKQTLAKLKFSRGNISNYDLPRIISLSEFWQISAPHFITDFDKKKLRSFDVKHIRAEACPDKSSIRTLRDRWYKQANLIEKFVFVLCWSICIGAGYFSFGILTLEGASAFLGVTFLSGIFSKMLSIHLGVKLSRLLPSSKKYVVLSELRGKITRQLHSYVREFEESYNGVVWRLEHSQDCELEKELSVASRKGYYFKVADNYEKYVELVEKYQMSTSI